MLLLEEHHRFTHEDCLDGGQCMSKAEALKKELDLLPTSPFMTADLVLGEFANCLSQPPYRITAATVIDKIRADRNTTVVSFDSERMEKALALYKGRPDKAWGLVDCFSFVVMRERRLKTALCFDEHFRQAGFEVPLFGR